ncbi:MAG: type II toxin-antitoxin system VapC family toxin [Caldilineaceae bacterium]
MTPIMLDMSGYAAFLRGRAHAVDAIRAAPAILVPVTVLGELRAGFEIGMHKERNQAELAAFLHSRRVAVVPVTEATTVRYATIYAFLRGIGRPIPTNDLWIAAAAMEHSVALLTADHHFHAVPHILLEFIPADS